jgi:uncharacterized protein (TIRG00374 family)
MQENDNVLRKFKGYRIWIPILIGLGISVFLLLRSLQDTRFIEIKSGEVGTHVWQDVNNNHQVDFWNNEEFIAQKDGKFRKVGIADVLSKINWTYYSVFWIIAAICMMLVRDFAYMLRIRILTDKQLSWKSSFFVIMIWEFASALTPGVVGGSAVAMFILHKEKINLGRSTAIVVITALMDNLFFVIMVPILFFLIGSKALFPSEDSIVNEGIIYLFWGGYAVIFTICVLLFMGIFLFPNLILTILNFLFKLPFLKRFLKRAQRTGIEVRTTAKQFTAYPFTYWLKIFGATFLSWTGRYLVINFILMAFVSLNFMQNGLVFAKQFIMWVLMLVSPTPGASGVAEWAFSNLLSDFAPSALLIISLAIIWRLISYFPYLFLGAFILPRWLKRNQEEN